MPRGVRPVRGEREGIGALQAGARVQALDAGIAPLALAVRLGRPEAGLAIRAVRGSSVLVVTDGSSEREIALPASVAQARTLAGAADPGHRGVVAGAQVDGGPPGLAVLHPPPAVFEAPAAAIAAALGLELAPAIPAAASDGELLDFCRRHGWSVRLRPDAACGEAVVLADWFAVRRACAEHNSGKWLLEALEGDGREELHFCALGGELIEAAHLVDHASRGAETESLPVGSQPLQVTRASSSMAIGERTAVSLDADLRAALQALVTDWGWTGGGCVVMRSAPSGERRLDGLNPCFGPGIDALAAAGINLPGSLLASAAPHAGERGRARPARAAAFAGADAGWTHGAEGDRARAPSPAGGGRRTARGPR